MPLRNEQDEAAPEFVSCRILPCGSRRCAREVIKLVISRVLNRTSFSTDRENECSQRKKRLLMFRSDSVNAFVRFVRAQNERRSAIFLFSRLSFGISFQNTPFPPQRPL